MVAFMLGGVGLTWWSVGMAVGLWVSLVALLRVMGKADPNLSAVYFNLIKYKPVYQARPYALEQQVQWK